MHVYGRVRLPARTLRALRRNLRAHVRAGQLQITVFALVGKAALDPLGKDFHMSHYYALLIKEHACSRHVP